MIDIVGSLNLSAFLAKHERKSRVGRSAYDPVVMLTLILYCYCNGVTSTRGIERHCRENIPCRIITGNQVPDHDTVADFLSKHRDQFDGLFQQVLEIADQQGLVGLDVVALDGSKIQANASKHKAMSYQRMCEKLQKLPEQIDDMKKQIRKLDEDGTERASREAAILKQEVEFQRKRMKKIKSAKKQLEKRAKQKAKEEAKEKKNQKKQGKRIRKIKDRDKALPEPKDQINFTDPDSRIMGHPGDFDQRYNAQAVVDSYAQIIVAHDVVQHANDKKLLKPMLSQVHERLGRSPNKGLADAGYFNEEHIKSEALETIELLVPPDRESHPRKSLSKIGRISSTISCSDRMRRKLSTKAGKNTYKLRKCIVEPVFGQVKHSVFAFVQFSWRGLPKVRQEWALVCAAHNLIKIWRNRNHPSEGPAKPLLAVTAA